MSDSDTLELKKKNPFGLATTQSSSRVLIITQERRECKCIIAMFVTNVVRIWTQGRHVTAIAGESEEQMKTIAVINLKGGVGKTTTTLSMAHELSRRYEKKVLIVDNDPQANCTKFFGFHDYDSPSMEDVMKEPSGTWNIRKALCTTTVNGIDLIPSNLNLEDASAELMTNKTDEQNTKLCRALEPLASEYDFCIIDCPPGIGLNVINALCAADDVIIPIKIDKNALDGMEELMEIVDEVRDFGTATCDVHCLVTMYQRDPMIDAGCVTLAYSSYPCFETKVRHSAKVVGATFWRDFIAEYSPRCAASVDYRKVVKEYLAIIEEGGDADA